MARRRQHDGTPFRVRAHGGLFIPVVGGVDLELPADGTPVDVPADAHDLALRLIEVGRIERVDDEQPIEIETDAPVAEEE